MSTRFASLRRRLTLSGGHATSGISDAITGRSGDADFRPAELIEPPLRAIAVGAPEAWQEDVAFLDGTQHVELLGYVGTMPIIGAIVSAAVRLREVRQLRCAVELTRCLVLGRTEAIAHIGDEPGLDLIALDDDVHHPIRDVQAARSAVDRARTGLEVAAAAAFRASFARTWLIVDGTLTITPGWGRDQHMLGIVKSHAMLPFEGDELFTYLNLGEGQRTSIFKPASRHVTPLYSWALRLHDHAGKDLFHGFIRVEAPASDGTVDNADRISRALLAERAPLAADPRADRLLYGIHDVERYLGARFA